MPVHARRLERSVAGGPPPGGGSQDPVHRINVARSADREGLYSSHLATWRAARERGDLVGLRKKRGPAPRVTDSRDKVIADQARELTRWKYRAERAEALVEVQKKVAALLGTPLGGEQP
jgi:hypothetical protein